MAAAALPPPENGIVIDVDLMPPGPLAALAAAAVSAPPRAPVLVVVVPRFGVSGRLPSVRTVSMLVLFEYC